MGLKWKGIRAFLNAGALVAAFLFFWSAAHATPFTTVVPATGVALPDEYPEAGGVAIVLTGVNGNVYFQFSDPDGAFRGFNSNGQPVAFRGNPFTINDPIPLDCGFRSCSDYFGGTIARMDVRFSAYDGDTQPGGFDENDITLVMNGFDVGGWSGLTTEATNNEGTTSFGFRTGFGNNTFNTAWFSSTNAALLNNILATGQTTTQVRDDDPNDNYWDFRRGESLADEAFRTIAPGYELEKTRRGGDTTFTAVGQTITYDYVVRNIGSVDIDNIAVSDDKIGVVSCSPTTLPKTVGGGSAAEAFCTATYVVTQEDFDAGVLTNIATATGDPEFGSLGALNDTVTLTGPAISPAIELEKTATPSSFTGPNETITYTFTVRNTGDATLSNVSVTDPMLPGLSCGFAEIQPLSALNTDNEEVCTFSYSTTQEDVDNSAAGTALVNTASVTSTDPNGGTQTDSDSATVTGPVSQPALTVTKSALEADYVAVGDVLNYEIVVTNTGNVTWTDPVTIDDALTSDEVCPDVDVAPGGSVTCTASFTIAQPNLDAEEVPNTADVEITVNGVTAMGSASTTVPADVQASMTVEKSLASGPDPFSATSDALVYSYIIRNTGNVILNAVDASDDKVGLNCPAATIPAGGSMTCTSDPYNPSQLDLNAGFVTNEVTVTATTGTGGPVADATDTLTVQANQLPALTVDKTAETILPGDFATGTEVDYSYLVTNSGNVELPGPFTVNDDKITGAISCPAGALAPSETVTCNATYTVQPADVAAGFVTNSATVTDGMTTSSPDTATVPQSGTPGITLDKIADTANFDETSDALDYRFVITNSGETAIDGTTQPITVNDPDIAGVDCSAQPATLFPVGSGNSPTSFTCTGTFTGLDQADIDAGFYTNTATASFVQGGATVTSPGDSATVPANITPSLTLTKTAAPTVFSAVDDEITFTFLVTNNTVQTISTVTVTDPLIPGLSCTLTNIGPLGSQSCTGTFDIRQQDMDAGSLTNTATANGLSSTGTAISDSDDATVTIAPGAADPRFTLDKIASTNSFAAVGDTINYTIEVENTGNITLTDVVVTDTPLGLTCNLSPLAPGAVDTSCTGTHVITQDDIDAGTYANAASATATGATPQADVETATGPARTPALTVSKDVDGPYLFDGDDIVFTFTATNSGNVTLTNVTVSENTAPFGPYICVIGTLIPGATDSSCQLTYTVDQDDIDAGQLSNTATITADSPIGSLSEPASETVDGPAESIDLSITKTELDGTGTFGVVSTTETYDFSITNNSNVTVTSVQVVDPLLGLNCTIPSIAPGATVPACGTERVYTIQQVDIDRGSLNNVVSVNATTDQGTMIAVDDSVTLQGPDQLPALLIDKTSPTADFDAVGDTLTYSYLVTNNGNITITAPITVADDRTTVSCPALPPAGLAPSASITCTATDTVDQGDLDTGSVTNTASASVTMPVVANSTYPGGIAAVTSPDDSVTITADQAPELSIAKAVLAGTPSTYSATTDVITFEFTVTNTGNVTTTAPITVNDPDIGAPFTCGAAGVAPGGSITCTGTWSPDLADLNSGSFTNSATASTIFNAAPVTTAMPAEATVVAVQLPELTATKVLDPSATLNFAAGQTATYDYEVTNTGNVTIDGPITIEDNIIGTIACGAASLIPGASTTCSASYVIQLSDIELGSITNIATGNGTDPNGDPTVSDPVAETIPTFADPAIEITKVADVASFSAVGQQIEYTYTVTNTSRGNPTGTPPTAPPALAQPIVIEDDKFASPINCFPGGAQLLPGATYTCDATALYTVTQDDLDAVQAGLATGFVTNNANGRTTFGMTDVISDPVQVTVPGEAAPLLTVTKDVTLGDEPASVGDDLTYTITVTNDGNQTVNNIVVSDPRIPSLSCTINGVAAGASFTLVPDGPTSSAVCTGVYTVDQDDIDAQDLSNTATATGANPQGAIVDGTGSDSHPIEDDDASVAITKDLADGEPDSAFSAVGQEIVYEIAVENDGNVTLSNTVVTDILFPGQQCTIGALAPGEIDSTTCSFTYTVTQQDIDSGEIFNEATATSTSAAPGNEVVTDTDDITGDGPDREPEISLVKDTVATSFDTLNEPIVYTFTVANTGNITLTDLPIISDDKIASVTCDPLPPGGLLPNTFTSCSGTYLVRQVDLDAGVLTNNATATVANPLDPLNPLMATAGVTIDAVQTSGMTIDKIASDTADVSEGDTITYTYTISNTGNVTLSNLLITDNHASASGTSALTIANNPIASLLPNTSVQRTAQYVVTQDDIDAGADLTNLATVAADVPVGAPPVASASDDETVTVEAADPSLEVIKTVTAPAVLEPGEDVVFTITVENDGNVTLTGISVVDTLTRADASVVTPAPNADYQSGDAGVVGELEVDEIWTYQVTHTLAQEDIDAGGLSNSARAFGTDPFNTAVDDISDNGTGTGSTPTTLIIPPQPAIEGEKVVTSSDIELGDTVRFEIRVTNTGNVTLTSVDVASDTLIRADGTPLSLTSGPAFFSADAGSASGTLQVDETATYRASYVLTQDDIDAGGISNSAVVTGTPPVGSPVTDTTDDGDDGDGNTTDDVTEFDIPASPALTLDKALTAGGPTFDQVDDTLTYTFTVTNSGNVTITDPITINDPLITDAGGTITCDPVPLAPLASLTCTGSYDVTQDDLNAGQVENTATAQSGATVSPQATETVPALQLPELETVKEAVSIEFQGTVYTDVLSQYFATGSIVTYEYEVTNVGNVTFTDPISVSDNLIASVSCPALPAGGLDPTESIVCEATYTVTVDDVLLASVTNLASSTSGSTTSPLVSETVPADGIPALTTVKELTSVANPDTSPSAGLTFDEIGDVLTYTFTVENTGEVPFASDINVIDDQIAGPILCFTSTAGDPDFLPGETVTCEASYTVDQEDLDAGEVVNQAYSETIFGAANRPVVSDPVTETAVADLSPAIEMTKSAATLPVTSVGQILTYTFDIENTGNQTLTSVVVTDPLIPSLSCEFATLAVGATESCSDTYEVRQDDVDAGSLTNNASIDAVTPQGGSVDDTASVTVAMPAAMPAIRMEKTATPVPFGAVGTGITYVFEVFNDGNVTLSNVTVTDPIDPTYSCVIPRVDVGTSDASCSLNVTVTQDDKDRGFIENTAMVEGTDPFGTDVDASDTISTASEPAMPGIEATKTASSSGTVAGSVVTYTLTLRNTGDVTLTVGSITDTMQRRGDGSTTALDAPFAGLTGDTDLDGRLDVTEVWTYTATKTITTTDIDQGGFDNTVDVSATDPFGTVVIDTSDDGNDADGNTVDDATEFEIIAAPSLELTKTLTTGGSAAGDVVIFEIAVVNTGNVTLSNVTLSDTMTRADGTDITSGITGPNLVSPTGSPSALPAGDTWIYEVSYTLTQEDVDAGGISNTVLGEGTPPIGPVVRDVSDNGDDTDGNTTDDATRLVITPAPEFEARKVALPFDDPSAPVFAGDEVQFFIFVENSGNVTLRNLVVTDTLTNLAGDSLMPDSIVQTFGASPTEIAPGEENIYRVRYTLTQRDIDVGGIQNSANADVTTPAGVPLTDVSDDGDDSDGNTLDDPTVVNVAPFALATAEKVASVPTRLSGNEFVVTFTMTTTNTGNVTMTNVAMSDDLGAFVAPATLVGVTTPSVSGFSGTGGTNAGYNGVSNIALLSSGLDLAPGATGEVSIDVTFDVTNGVPENDNTVTVNSDVLSVAVEASVGILPVSDPDVAAIKSVSPSDALLGGVVTYTLAFDNNAATAEGGLTIVDDLPVGVSFVPDSALIDGSATPAPTLTGRRLEWSPVTLAPNSTTVITFEARVTGGAAGELVNRAYAVDADGTVVSNVATATLRRAPEAVFDCSEVIGKVFNDRNLNGYQDPIGAEDRRLITDQTFDGGKGKLTEDEQAEEGLPNVRVVTVDGTVITTDQFGRFNVPCAALPADIGSNFTLKLDTNSLPTGFMVTTENPRVVRLTAGTTAKLNFGAALANVVDIDLLSSAFEAGSAMPTPALTKGVQDLVAQIGAEPTLLNLTYFFGSEGRELARQRLDQVEGLIRQSWPRADLDQLAVERTISRLQ